MFLSVRGLYGDQIKPDILICAHTTRPVSSQAEPPSPKKKKKKIITQIVSPPNHDELNAMYEYLFLFHAQYLYLKFRNNTHLFCPAGNGFSETSSCHGEKNELHHMIDDVRRWLKDSHHSVCGAGENHKSLCLNNLHFKRLQCTFSCSGSPTLSC